MGSGEDLETSEGMAPLKKEVVVEKEVKPEISLIVVLGTANLTTMRILDTTGGTQAVLLVNSGSTHNFLDPSILQKAKLPIDTSSTLPVKIANGKVIHSIGLCSNVTTKL